MNKIVDKMYQKAEEVLFVDKLKAPNEVSKILSSEIHYVLSQYFDVKENSFKSSIFLEKDGELNIYFSFKANRVLLKRTTLN